MTNAARKHRRKLKGARGFPVGDLRAGAAAEITPAEIGLARAALVVLNHQPPKLSRDALLAAGYRGCVCPACRVRTKARATCIRCWACGCTEAGALCQDVDAEPDARSEAV